jgi:hypothetical protein
MVVKVADAPEACSELAQFVVFGGLAVGLLHQPKDPLHSFRIGRVWRGRCGIELAAYGLAIVRRPARVFFITGTLPVDALENPVRIGPETH